MDPRFGGAEMFMPIEPLIDCATTGEFMKALCDFVELTKEVSQRVLYFTGHGRSERNQFAFEFDGTQSAAFDVVASLLAPTSGRRNLFIVDSCYSGGAAAAGLKSGATFPVSAGSCVLSSCRETELSREVPGHGSLFTHYLCEGIRTGLDGIRTPEGMISVTDVVTHVRRKLGERGDGILTRQTPTYSVIQGEGAFWIATNVSGALVDGLDERKPRLDGDPLALPPAGATFADLDEAAIQAFAGRHPSAPADPLQAAQQLGMLSAVGDDRPSAAAILCFGKAPHRFFPDVASIFSVGDKASGSLVAQQVEGTLVQQYDRFIELLLRHLDTHSTFDASGSRSDRFEIEPAVLREVVANALTHRDFVGRGRVQVHIDERQIEIVNPGAFPDGHGWEALLERPGKSLTGNRRVANFLNKLGTVEGLGRGFHVLKAFRETMGNDALRFEQAGGVVACYLRRAVRTDHAGASAAAGDMLERETEKQLGQALALQARSLPHVQMFGQRFALEKFFVEPMMRRADGHSIAYHMLLEQVRKTTGYKAVIIGAAGMGKTMLFRKLAFDLQKSSEVHTPQHGSGTPGEEGAAAALDEPLILSASFRNLNADLPLVSAIAQGLGAFPTALDHALHRRRTILLLDGYDEIASEQRSLFDQRIAGLVEDHPDLSILLCSRPAASLARPPFDAEMLTIMPFTRGQALRMTDLGEPGTLAKMIAQLPEDSPLLANPLLGQIAGLTFSGYGRVPDMGHRVGPVFVEYMLKRHDTTKGQYRRALTLDPALMGDVVRTTALMMLMHGESHMEEQAGERLIGAALRLTGRGAERADPRRVLDEMIEYGFFLQRDGDHIVAFHRSIMEQLAVEGARVISDPEIFTRLVMLLLQRHRSVQLSTDLLEGWISDRAQGEAVLERLRENVEHAPEEVAMLLEQVIAKSTGKLPERHGATEGLFDLPL
ncbi:hypothetical protein HD841_000920 [Sphingomonas melonis]|uniref:NACHT domain-containing protein n=2 Tax=Sphingomonas melonis TaxID=152682 RepID=A0A7Y9K0Q8_9SPHN|nr:hypothetical protein [Sphingomonas melonis]